MDVLCKATAFISNVLHITYTECKSPAGKEAGYSIHISGCAYPSYRVRQRDEEIGPFILYVALGGS